MKEHGIKIIGDKGVYNKQDMAKIERQLSEGEAELKADFFDDAETNQDVNIYPDIIGFEDTLEHIGADLDELRKNRTRPIIPDELVASAINIYIENALILVKNDNLIDVSQWDSVGDQDIDFKPAGEERRLMQKASLRNKGKEMKRIGGDFDDKEDREKGLLELAQHGQLFHINMKDIYKSVGKTQVRNFRKIYGTHLGK